MGRDSDREKKGKKLGRDKYWPKRIRRDCKREKKRNKLVRDKY